MEKYSWKKTEIRWSGEMEGEIFQGKARNLPERRKGMENIYRKSQHMTRGRKEKGKR